jgi:hypothetical protein
MAAGRVSPAVPASDDWFGSAAWVGQPAPTMAEVEQWANQLAARRRRGETVTLDEEIEQQTLLVRAFVAIEAREPKVAAALIEAKARLLRLEVKAGQRAAGPDRKPG